MNKLTMPNMKDVLGRLRLSALEGVALVATVIFTGIVVFNYLNSTQPLRSKLSQLRTKEKTLQNEFIDKTAKKKGLDEQLENKDKILDSLESFEARLHSRKTGITAIIDEVNQIAKAHHVKAGDITFRTDAPEPLLGEPKPGATPGTTPTPAPITRRDKLPIVYEGLGIDTTVEGDYADLRRFISTLEHSRNFVIISAVTLQSVDEKQRNKIKNAAFNAAPDAAPPSGGLNAGAPMTPPAGPGQPAGAPSLDPGGPNKIVVALKIEMETHFSRQGDAKLLPANASVQR